MESLLTAGLGMNFKRSDRIALALYYGRPSDSELRDQYGFEALYQLNIYSNFYVVPSTQILINPSNNPNTNIIGVFSLRIRLAL